MSRHHRRPGSALGAVRASDLYQALNQAVLLAYSPRQTRKGNMTSWKAFVPGYSGKLAIEAVDRAMRGETSPSPVYEGESGVIAYMLDGPEACYTVSLPEPGEPLRAILETFTKAHSVVNHARARSPAHDHRLVAPRALGYRPHLEGGIPPDGREACSGRTT